MRFIDLPFLWNALAILGDDNGASPRPDAEVPPRWQKACLRAEGQLRGLTRDQQINLVVGEHRAQRRVARKAPQADEVLTACFDGELSEIVFVPWAEAVAYGREMQKRIQNGEDVT